MGMLRPARSLPAPPPSRVRVQAGGAHAIGRRSGRRVVRSLQGVTQALGARVRDGRLSTATGREAQGCICQHALQRRRRSTGQRRASGAGCCRICERDGGRAGRRRPAGARLAARRGRPDCARTLSRCPRARRGHRHSAQDAAMPGRATRHPTCGSPPQPYPAPWPHLQAQPPLQLRDARQAPLQPRAQVRRARLRLPQLRLRYGRPPAGLRARAKGWRGSMPARLIKACAGQHNQSSLARSRWLPCCTRLHGMPAPQPPDGL